MSFSFYIISVGYRYGNILKLCCRCRLLVLFHSDVILLVSATGMVLFSCYIISVGYWSGVILMLHYYLRLLAWFYSHVILLASDTGLVSF